MVYTGRDFTSSDVGEDETYTLDFIKELATGETLVSSTWYCTVAEDSEGEDESPQDHVYLSPDIEGTKSKQRINGLLEGVKYVLQSVCITNYDNTISLWSHVTCRLPE